MFIHGGSSNQVSGNVFYNASETAVINGSSPIPTFGQVVVGEAGPVQLVNNSFTFNVRRNTPSLFARTVRTAAQVTSRWCARRACAGTCTGCNVVQPHCSCRVRQRSGTAFQTTIVGPLLGQ